MSKAPAIFDHAKLDWFNGQHLRRLAPEDLAPQLRPYLQQAELEIGDDLVGGAALIRERLTVLSEAPQWLAFLGPDVQLAAPELTPKRLAASATAALLRTAAPILAGVGGAADDAGVEESLRTLASAAGAKFGDLMMALRLATTGSTVSPPLFGSLRLLGATKVARRLEAAIAVLADAGSEEEQR
jgi:glutamyl-tRNA synthetase